MKGPGEETGFGGTVEVTPQYHAPFSTGFRLAFAIFAALRLVGVFSSLARGNMPAGAPAGSLPDARTSGSG